MKIGYAVKFIHSDGDISWRAGIGWSDRYAKRRRTLFNTRSEAWKNAEDNARDHNYPIDSYKVVKVIKK